MISIHNVKNVMPKADLHIYCGRNGWKYPKLFNAKMGNPFIIGEGRTREQSIQQYTEWVVGNEWHMKVIHRLAQRVKEGKTIALYCHCVPDDCHCDVIAAKAMEIVNA